MDSTERQSSEGDRSYRVEDVLRLEDQTAVPDSQIMSYADRFPAAPQPSAADLEKLKVEATERAIRRSAEIHEDAYEHMAGTIAAGRLGRPEEFGDACAFLCSAQAGFISGQNLQVDGGSYEGLI